MLFSKGPISVPKNLQGAIVLYSFQEKRKNLILPELDPNLRRKHGNYQTEYTVCIVCVCVCTFQ